MQTYGFAPDLLEPPNGGYCFIEFEDLDWDHRVLYLVTRAGTDVATCRAVGVHNAVLDACIEFETIVIDSVIDMIKDAIAEYEDPSKRVEKEWSLSVEANQKTGFLTADPREIRAVIDGMAAGTITPSTVFSRKGVPTWTCGSESKGGSGFSPTAPGSIVRQITVGPCQPHVRANGDGGYKVPVVYK